MARTDSPAPDLEAVRALMVSYVDNSGVARLKLLPAHKVPGAAEKGATVSTSVAVMLSADDHVNNTSEIDSTVGDLRQMPDLSALAVLDPARGLAWAPADLYDLDGSPHPTCPRSALRRISAQAEAAGYRFALGIELEFSLFRGTKEQPVLAHDGPGYGNLAFLELEAWHLDLLDALAQAGLPVEQLHPEYGRGQMELSLAPRDPVRAVDDAVLARLVITRVSLAHGLLVSFAPVPVVGNATNGSHMHLSAQKDGSNIFFDPDSPYGFSPEAGHMTAGILERLDEGIALLGGTILSFERLRPHNWAGAAICWGPGNREAAIRYMPGFAGFGAQQSNIEVKGVDPAANPYLAAAALLASALDGVERRSQLPAPVLADPASLSAEELAAAGMRRFPQDLEAGLDLLQASDFFRQVFGPMLVDAYVAVRRHEWDAYGDKEPQEVAALARWRF